MAGFQVTINGRFWVTAEAPIVSYTTSGPSSKIPKATIAVAISSHKKYQSLRFARSALVRSSICLIKSVGTGTEEDLASDTRRTTMLIRFFQVLAVLGVAFLLEVVVCILVFTRRLWRRQ